MEEILTLERCEVTWIVVVVVVVVVVVIVVNGCC